MSANYSCYGRWYHLAMGLAHDFPLCCIFVWLFVYLGSSEPCAQVKGAIHDLYRPDRVWVPCAYHRFRPPKGTEWRAYV